MGELLKSRAVRQFSLSVGETGEAARQGELLATNLPGRPGSGPPSPSQGPHLRPFCRNSCWAPGSGVLVESALVVWPGLENHHVAVTFRDEVGGAARDPYRVLIGTGIRGNFQLR